ncbi:ABC transporter ATP-binding protein [Prosthecomicrobium pneumaticum]|uniref:NitT/TauT family transport system ATP-binding protein n=1 Tax=Prosthecomicrobium pneumaticum TaxID=81895 RepID=A0A7W9CVK4_9HYPH|nr:ABC transporter ATP-binding protein [Prosthecomicrobium pneumaticum]MBB5752707.1 NitT/TauT family transport system ATP-binding protein [Prosthecomicrobium pneumaticum]
MSEIVIDRVGKAFEIDGKSVPALVDVSLRFEAGGFYALIGPSGCGKSTLLRLIADILAPTDGVITIGGQPPGVARRQHEIGFVFQEASLLPWRSVIDNIELPLEIAGGPVGDRPRPESLVRLVGLSGFENAKPAQLSGGMQQRVSIARALALRPKVLLLDEPFGALDEITRQRMNLELLRIWQETGTTAVLVTHTIGEAVFMADAVHVLAARPGRLVDTIEVDLPRPRRLALMQTPEFNRLENRVRAALFGDELAETADG